jgi:hypothetical protein
MGLLLINRHNRAGNDPWFSAGGPSGAFELGIRIFEPALAQAEISIKAFWPQRRFVSSIPAKDEDQ